MAYDRTLTILQTDMLVSWSSTSAYGVLHDSNYGGCDLRQRTQEIEKQSSPKKEATELVSDIKNAW